MKIAFLVERITHYKLYAPIIEEALARRYDVECWHDYGQPRVGQKGYQFPSRDSAPEFRNGSVRVLAYEGQASLAGVLMDEHPDWLLCLTVPSVLRGSGGRKGATMIAGLQTAIDYFHNNRAEGLLGADLSFLFSDWWVDFAIPYMAAHGYLDGIDGFEQAFCRRARVVGFPELDQTEFLDRIGARRKWGLSESAPIVLLLPFPPVPCFWAQRIYLAETAVSRLGAIVRERRWRYLRHVLNGWHDPGVVRAIREFCDRNDAQLVVKGRAKTAIPGYMHELADKCIYDEQYYPATILEALSIASLCVSSFSSTVLEAAWLGVPHLNIHYPPESCDDYPEFRDVEMAQIYNAEEDGVFQFSGVSRCMAVSELIRRLPSAELGDFKMSEVAREKYLRKFLGFADGKSTARVMQILESEMQGEPQQ